MVDIESEFVDRHEHFRRKAENEEHHGIRAGYHEGGYTSQAESVRRMREVVADEASIEAEDRVVDIGCGFGDCLVWLAEKKGVEGVGIDIAQPQVNVAKELAAERDVDTRVRFRKGDLHELSSVVTGDVDLVWAIESLMYSRRIEKVVDEVTETLDGSGQFVVADTFLRRDSLSSDQERHLQTVYEGDKSDFDRIDSFEERLVANGFDVRRREITEHVRPELSRIKKFARLYRPLFWVGHRLGVVSSERFASISSPISTDALFEDGVIEYCIVSARL